MPAIPNMSETPLIRTDFSDEVVWQELAEATRRPSEDGFVANLQLVSQEEFKGLSPEQLGKCAADTNHAVLFVADDITMTHLDRPVLCIDLFAPGQMFRVIPSELWSAENNLSLANMDFEDFIDAVGSDGVFRGF